MTAFSGSKPATLLCLVGAGLAGYQEAVLWGPGHISVCRVPLWGLPFLPSLPFSSLICRRRVLMALKQLTNSQRTYKLRVDTAIETSVLFLGKPVVISCPFSSKSLHPTRPSTLVFFHPPSFSLLSHSWRYFQDHSKRSEVEMLGGNDFPRRVRGCRKAGKRLREI